jgi:spoIIIJ-associated protein
MGMVVAGDEIPEADQDDEAQIGKVVLNELLTKMDITARIVVRRAKPGEPGEATPWVLDVAGSNLNRLIGRRGETLAALQYITRLITSRELQRRSEVVVDIGGYKAKRAQTLHNLAIRMADEAVQRDHTVSLEPMPPHERRIIHLALRERSDVVTRSIGEGASRKVTIVPSSQA